MMHDENEPIRRPATHVVDERLDDLSIAELDARVGLLKAEITRLEEARAKKQAALAGASAFFKS